MGAVCANRVGSVTALQRGMANDAVAPHSTAPPSDAERHNLTQHGMPWPKHNAAAWRLQGYSQRKLVKLAKLI